MTSALDAFSEWLSSRTAAGVRFGLKRTEALLAGARDPHRRFRSLHVGGTNGKGTVAALAAAALREHGLRTGLYTSPHLVSFDERIRVDGVPLDAERILDAAERLRPRIEEVGATFFEAATAIAFVCFAEAGVEVAVVEVGLGGRLDATNVIEPLAVALTNVSLDHTEYLGDTLEAIAREKAGILKRGVPAITGVRSTGTDAPVLDVLRERAAAVGAPLTELDRAARIGAVEVTSAGVEVRLESRAWGRRTLRTTLPGEHQARNAALAAELLALLPRDLRPGWPELERAFAGTRWPGRVQVERIAGTTWVFDVAHNPAGASTLAGTLQRLDLPRPIVFVFGVLADKDWRSMLAPLLERMDGVILTDPPSSPPERRWNPGPEADWVRERGGSPRLIPEFDAALGRASTLAPHGTVVVTGSFHTVGDAMARLGIAAV